MLVQKAVRQEFFGFGSLAIFNKKDREIAFETLSELAFGRPRPIGRQRLPEQIRAGLIDLHARIENRREVIPAFRHDTPLDHLALDTSTIAALGQIQGAAQNLHGIMRPAGTRNGTLPHRFLDKAIKTVWAAFVIKAFESGTKRTLAGQRLG